MGVSQPASKRLPIGLSLLLVWVCGFAVHAAEEDVLYLDDGTKAKGVVVTEGVDFIKVRVREDLPTRDYRPKDVLRIEYGGMQTGAYAKGVAAREAGDYAEAAAAFERVVSNAVREWQQVYGGYALGDALARQEQHGAAADAFVAVTEAAPKHRLFQEAAYRAGVALARSDRMDEARAMADRLIAYSKDLGGRSAQQLAMGVRAVVALEQGDFASASKLAREINRLRYREIPEVWYHWNTLWAEALLAKYGVMSPPMEQALGNLGGIPVDIRPYFPVAGEQP
jgi:tetratricopeptide (TPR) repeat protein